MKLRWDSCLKLQNFRKHLNEQWNLSWAAQKYYRRCFINNSMEQGVINDLPTMEMMIAIKLKWCPWSCNLSPDYVSSLTLHSTGAKSEIASVILPSHFHLWHHLLLNVALLAGMPWQPSSGLQSGILQLKCLDIRDQGRRDMGGSSPAKPTPAKSQRMMVPKKKCMSQHTIQVWHDSFYLFPTENWLNW